jgi:hypothetical protein
MKTSNWETQFSIRDRVLWLLSTAVGWSLGLTVGLALGEVSGRYTNVAFYETAGYLGSYVRDIVAGLCVGIATGILQSPFTGMLPYSIKQWPLKSALLTTLGFVVARALGAPVVSDVQSGPLFSFGFFLPPRWFPATVGLANYALGGPIAGALVGVTLSLLRPAFVRARVKNLGKWLMVSSLPATVALTVGSIPSLLGVDLIVIAVTTGISYATVDTLLLRAQFDQLDIQVP